MYWDASYVLQPTNARSDLGRANPAERIFRLTGHYAKCEECRLDALRLLCLSRRPPGASEQVYPLASFCKCFIVCHCFDLRACESEERRQSKIRCQRGQVVPMPCDW